MDYSYIIHELRSASLFDLFRLQAAIGRQLDDPERIEQVRSRLRPGMTVHYFDVGENRLIEATVVELHRTRLLVRNRADAKLWSIGFCAVNIDEVDTDLRPDPEKKGMDRSQLRVGDQVGFLDRQNRERYGTIISLNQKTVSILTNERQKWRVAYVHLFPVLIDVTSQ